ncbi:hypothetical protein D9613_010113 [Agrocybe pediades]|uniref:Tim44-like domain-containing protein n=1 Tax=Agrocybe pediades TaxID=84607 RepID=A0A8H4QY06_9AGAR|nr:hypothetical protein D9613_010113 [Agrocybe pediades]
MALRSCISTVLNHHQGFAVRLHSSSSRLAPCSATSVYSRTYATASATLTSKTPVTAKGTKHDAHLINKPSKKKTAATVPPKKATSPEMETAQHLTPAPQAAKTETATSEELQQIEQLKEMERVMAFQHLMPTVDAWGQEVKETLDVQIPRSITAAKTPKSIYQALKANFINSLKNVSALASLATMNAIPGLKEQYSWKMTPRLFGTQSVKPDGLLAPVRKAALQVYEDLNKAVANRSDKDIKRFTTASYQTQALELARKFRGKTKSNKGRFIWQLHRVVNPVQVLSLRVTEGYLAPDAPRYGNRLMIHALVKFDTEQSLEIYNEKGVALHTPSEEAHNTPAFAQPVESWRVPASKKRVTEYLILERRMWIPGDWQIREQVWPALEGHDSSTNTAS